MAANRFFNFTGRLLLVAAFVVTGLLAAEHHGTVTSGGLPVPGATVTAVQGDKKVTTSTDDNGFYSFSELADGVWTITVEMPGFEKVSREIGVAADAPAPVWDLKMQSLAELTAPPPAPPAAATPAAPKPAETAAAPKPAETKPATPATPQAAAANSKTAAPANAKNSKNATTSSGRPSLTQALGGQTSGAVRSEQQGGFQRVGVSQSGDFAGAAAGADAGANPPEMTGDLSGNANDSFAVNGSVSSGLDMQQGGGDWMMGGGRGGMFGGPGGMGPGGDMGPGGAQGDQSQMATGGAGGGRGGRGGGGPGGGGPGGGGPGGFGGGPGGGFGGGFGGRGGGGRGGPGGPGGRGGRGNMSSFGNNRRNAQSRYNFAVSGNLTNSFLNARTYSTTGQVIAKPNAQGLQSTLSAGGPLKIPHLFSTKGTFNINYSLTRNRTGQTFQGLVPTGAEEQGNFAGITGQNGAPIQLYQPGGTPYTNNQIPLTSISSTALALLQYYPAANFFGNSGVKQINYENSASGRTSQNNINLRLSYPISQKMQVNGGLQYQNGTVTSPNVFGFVDNRTNNGVNANASYIYHFTLHVIATTNYRYSQSTSRGTPYFATQPNGNIEGNLGIAGVDLEPGNYGPPALSFSNFLGLSDINLSYSHPRTSALGESVLWVHGRHEFIFGGDFSRRETNLTTQNNPRGRMGFTGAATSLSGNGATSGYDLADFLLGTPDTVSLAYSPNSFGDQYYRQSVYDLFATDQWRISDRLSLSLQLRWDYQAPTTELYNRLVNLDVAPGYTQATSVTAGSLGPLTGIMYPDSLLFPHKRNLEPRIGFAWRPFAKHSTVVRGGWGVYYNAGVYTSITNNFGQEPPFAVNYSLQNTCGLNLQNAFLNAAKPSAGCTTSASTNPYAVNPYIRIGYLQNWQISMQQNLKFNLVATVTYNGIKGIGLQQPFAPNTVPTGAKPAACPTGEYCEGYQYYASNGYSFYNSLSLQLQRRIRAGLGFNVQYVYNKSIDDVPSGLAQNWQDLGAELGPTAGVRANTLNNSLQYSTGVGSRAGGLISGWKGVLLKDWTITATVTTASGAPITPTAGQLTIPGTAITGTIRPDLVPNEPLYSNGTLNAAAFVVPASGQWGTMQRDYLNGPFSFSTSAVASRTFRFGDRKNVTFSLRTTNPMNHPVVSTWYTTVGSNQFGLPANYGTMRNVSANMRISF